MKKLLKSEVCGTCEQCTGAQCTVHGRKVKSSNLKKKKKKDETRFASRHGCKCSTQTGTKQFFFLATYFVLLIITQRGWDQIIEIIVHKPKMTYYWKV